MTPIDPDDGSDAVLVHCEECGHDAGLSWRTLAAHGLVPTPHQREDALAFFRPHRLRLRCASCDSRGTATLLPAPFHVSARCRDCDLAIPASRLAATPGATLCVSCQAVGEHPIERTSPGEVCDRCGSVMVWRVRRDGGPTTYFLGCSQFPRCWSARS